MEKEKKAKAARKLSHKGLVQIPFKVHGKKYNRGDTYSTKDKPLFDKLKNSLKIK
jgi:hypothetical protein